MASPTVDPGVVSITDAAIAAPSERAVTVAWSRSRPYERAAWKSWRIRRPCPG
ncbi:MAG: hypothetical protein R2705_19700 [Ilumatobacteraceae bacterium]